MDKNQRSLKNMFVQPKFPLKLSLCFLGIGGLILCIVALMVTNKLSEAQELINNTPLMDFQTQNQVNDIMFVCVQYSLSGFLAFVLFSFFFALLVSHRIAGPQVAIKAYIAALKEGNYDYQRNLRPYDELNDIMDALKDLRPTLMERDKTLEESS